MNYDLQYFTNISFNGFDFIVPDHVIKLISKLSMEVGSPSYIKTPVFKKNSERENVNTFTNRAFPNSLKDNSAKKKRGNKNMEISNEEWENLRVFQPTKIEKKTGIDSQIDQIRFLLNKLTDKTYLEMNSKIIEIINELIMNETVEEDMIKIGNFIFEAASTNKFYSKIYANLYASLIQQYQFLMPIFEKNYVSYMELFQKIESGDPDKDYNRFCEINSVNEKRKAISMFFINLTANNIITTKSIVEIVRDLLITILGFINEENKKNEVDEITENIAILYRKSMIDQIYANEKLIGSTSFIIDNLTITDNIKKLATSKSKDYKSLSSKAIFKYMDLIEM